MKLWVYVALGLAALAAVSTVVLYLESQGAEKERAKIEKENRNAYSKAREGRDAFLACDGVYHFDTGNCERP